MMARPGGLEWHPSLDQRDDKPRHDTDDEHQQAGFNRVLEPLPGREQSATEDGRKNQGGHKLVDHDSVVDPSKATGNIEAHQPALTNGADVRSGWLHAPHTAP